ncbi:unnamed protein product [Ophioblennius macclurei]
MGAKILPYSAQHDWTLDSGHQAKRARVENIIKGMTGCPNIYATPSLIDGKKNRESSSQQKHSERKGQSQFERRWTEVTANTNGNNEENRPSQSDAFTDSHVDCEEESSRKHHGWKKLKLMNYFQSKPDRMKLVAGALKYELSRAVSRSVDSIFKSMPLFQILPNEARNVDAGLRFSSEEIRDVQTEALSLVVQKSDDSVLRSRSRDRDENPGADRLRGLRCPADRCCDGGRSESDSPEAPWSAVKVRSKVNCRSVRSPPSHVPMGAIVLESLRLPHVKMECDGLVKSNLHTLNDGLTTNHLKKAKLVFFYTRYPSSQVLKTCFHDVQVRKSQFLLIL